MPFELAAMVRHNYSLATKNWRVPEGLRKFFKTEPKPLALYASGLAKKHCGLVTLCEVA